jgi:hypothetical protein
MQHAQIDYLRDNRLRLVFRDREKSFLFAANPTLGDVARALDEISRRRYGTPVAIYVTLKRYDS